MDIRILALAAGLIMLVYQLLIKEKKLSEINWFLLGFIAALAVFPTNFLIRYWYLSALIAGIMLSFAHWWKYSQKSKEEKVIFCQIAMVSIVTIAVVGFIWWRVEQFILH